jgi:hypothetical protein
MSLRNVTWQLLTDESVHFITLWTSERHLADDGEDHNDYRNALGLQLFVSALERHTSVLSVEFHNCRFRLPDGDESDPEYDCDSNGRRLFARDPEPLRLRCQAVERLFRSVLPSHPSITEVGLFLFS